jgi:predicted nucleic acid-binding protein
VIVYADSSVLARAYLEHDPGHTEALALLRDPDRPVITGSWSRIEVSGALVRAARSGRPGVVDEAGLLAAWDSDTTVHGAVTILVARQDTLETHALALVREHGLRAMDAWHLAAAVILTAELTDPGEAVAFASRDGQQADIAARLGFAAA